MFGANYFGQPYFGQGYGAIDLGNSIHAGYPRPAAFLDIPRPVITHEDKATGLPRDIKSFGSIETGKPFGLETEIKPLGFVENQTPQGLDTRSTGSIDIKDNNKPTGLIDNSRNIGISTEKKPSLVSKLDKPTLV